MVLAVNPPQLSTTLTTVLVIDDNDEDRKYWCDALKHSAHNYTVLEASNGQSGLNLCRSQRVDCIVLDLDMPESGFYVLFDLIRDRTRPQIAVVILTHLLAPNLTGDGKTQWRPGVLGQRGHIGSGLGECDSERCGCCQIEAVEHFLFHRADLSSVGIPFLGRLACTAKNK